MLSLVATFLAAFFDYTLFLQRGGRAVILVVVANRDQARHAFRYIRAFFEENDMMARMVERMSLDEIELNNRITIKVATASFRTIRGAAVVACLADEVAFWFDGEASANPAEEVITAVEHGMATIPNAMLLIASSPHAWRGYFWDNYARYFGKSGHVLVWQADTKRMNPSVRDSWIVRKYEQDPAKAKAEIGAEFRADLEAFISVEAIEAVTDKGVAKRKPEDGIHYVAFVDAASGSGGGDSMVLAIAHKDGELRYLDVVIERKPPFSPATVVAEFSAVLLEYGCRHVTGDMWTAGFVAEAFTKVGIAYRNAPLNRSEIYLTALPQIMSKKVSLLDNSRMVQQLVGLERRVTSGGRDAVDHVRGQHDDLANAACGALTLRMHRTEPRVRVVGGDDLPPGFWQPFNSGDYGAWLRNG